MRKRPLSVAILGWAFLGILIPNLIAATDPTKVPGSNSLGWSIEAVQIARSSLCIATAVFAVGILRGKAWARTGFIASLLLELARIALLGRSIEKSLFVVELLFVLLAIWALYRRPSRDFFAQDKPYQSLLARAGTALCHSLTTYFLTIAMGMLAGWIVAGDKAIYMAVLLSALAATSFGFGRRLGLILIPRSDLGTMLLIASVACMLPLIAGLSSGAGGVDNPATMRYVVLTMTICAVFFPIGLFLVSQPQKPLNNSYATPEENLNET
jgi:hypothetical protein